MPKAIKKLIISCLYCPSRPKYPPADASAMSVTMMANPMIISPIIGILATFEKNFFELTCRP